MAKLDPSYMVVKVSRFAGVTLDRYFAPTRAAAEEFRNDKNSHPSRLTYWNGPYRLKPIPSTYGKRKTK